MQLFLKIKLRKHLKNTKTRMVSITPSELDDNTLSFIKRLLAKYGFIPTNSEETQSLWCNPSRFDSLSTISHDEYYYDDNVLRKVKRYDYNPLCNKCVWKSICHKYLATLQLDI